MINFSDIKQGIVAAIGSIVLTTLAVGAAVGPARAVETAPVAYAQAQAGGTVHV